MRYCILRLLFLVATIIVSVHAFAQDLLTEQAPMDEKMVRIDSVVLSRFVKAEVYEYPADDLYPEWSNDYAHKYTNVVIPDSLLIDLTGFCMPTENTKVNDIVLVVVVCITDLISRWSVAIQFVPLLMGRCAIVVISVVDMDIM